MTWQVSGLSASVPLDCAHVARCPMEPLAEDPVVLREHRRCARAHSTEPGAVGVFRWSAVRRDGDHEVASGSVAGSVTPSRVLSVAPAGFALVN